MLTQLLIMMVIISHPCQSKWNGLDELKTPPPLETSAPDVDLMPGREWHNGTCYHGVYREAILRPQCQPRFIKNRYCYGQCNSVYVPQMESNFRICNACVPIEWHLKEIRLKCTTDSNRWTKPFHINVTIVKKCQCQKVLCDKQG